MDETPAAFTAKLVWQEAGTAKEINVQQDGVSIGRSTQNTLAITDLAASRFHCKILPEGEGFTLVDLDSTNGTFLNGERLSGSSLLKDGDQIQIGKLVFKVEISAVEGAEEAAQDGAFELPLEKTFIVPAETDAPWIMVSSGPGKGTITLLTKPKMEIGRASRDKQWDIDLVDKAVSRPHAEILHKQGEWRLKDLGSANGTKLNGARIQDESPLKDGDVIGIGETVLIYREKGGQ